MALLKRKRIGLNEAMDVVTKFVNACNRHDADGVAACLHADFDSIQPMYPSRNFRGADQVRRNWQAIFDAEPGFRLTVLRSAAADDTVWLELHGAGRDAEVAGIFIMGISGDRIRWARIYSALVEPLPEGVGETSPPQPLREVPPMGEPTAAGIGGVVEEELIAPVLDLDRSGRRRRRRQGDDADGEADAEPEVEVEDVATVTEDAPPAEPEAEPEVEAAAAPVDEGGDATEAVAIVWDEEPRDAEGEPAVVVVTTSPEAEVDVEVVAEPEVVAETEMAETETAEGTEAASEVVDPEPAAPVAGDEAPVVTDEETPSGSPKWRFGRRPKP